VRARRAALAAAAAAVAPCADAVAPAGGRGLAVAGEFALNSGMGEAARVYQAGVSHLGFGAGPVRLGIGARPSPAAPGAALLLAVNAPSLPLMLARAAPDFLRKRRVVGAWAWELPVVPAAWEIGARYVHEIWACSPYAAAALERILPGRVRAVPYPLGLLPAPSAQPDRAAFGLPDAAVVTAIIFNLAGSITRKNPLAGIAAHKRAFGDDPEQLLVIKISGAAAFPREAAAVLAAADARNIRVFSGDWPPARLASFLACADMLLSLHRAEGFGLVPAQAMFCGIPVVATGWSGNLAYMDATSAALAGYELVKVEDPTGIYPPLPGALWAEPDVAHAADLLRALGSDPAARAALGARGRAYAARALNGDALAGALAANGIDAQ
jgi:glycosyltransferase involved in cell wall biosynthesis